MPNFGERMSRQTQFLPGHVGGRVASAQPVRSRRTIGAAQQTVVAPPAWREMDKNASSPTTVEIEFFHTVGVGINTGDVVMAVVIARDGGTIGAPTGWTVLVTGLVGDTRYMVAWAPFSGSVDGSGYYTGTMDTTFDISTTAQLLTFSFQGTGTPAAEAHEYVDTTSVNVTATSTLRNPFSVVAFTYAASWSGASVAGSTATYFTSYQASRTWTYMTGSTVPGLDAGAGTVVVNGSGAATPDMVELVIGWI
jgi:hypothetical protein